MSKGVLESLFNGFGGAVQVTDGYRSSVDNQALAGARAQQQALYQGQLDNQRLTNNSMYAVGLGAQQAMAQGYRPGAGTQVQGDPRDQFAHMDYQRMSAMQQQAHYKHSQNRSGTYMGQEWPRQPIPIRCDGWVSDTLTLERHGYKFMVERDIASRNYRICIGKAGSRSMIVIPEFQYEDFLSSQRPLEFHGEFVTGMEVQYTKGAAPNFVAVNMNDAYWCEKEVEISQRRIDVRDLFPQSETADDESLIVLPDKQTVKEALEIILEKQAPRQEEIKRNRKRRDMVEKTQATIVTLEEIA